MLFYWDEDKNCSQNVPPDVDLNDTTIHWEKVSDNSTGETIASGDTKTIIVKYKHLESGHLLSHFEIVRPEIAFYDANVNDPSDTDTNDTTGAHDTACIIIDNEGPINEVYIYGDMGALAVGDETDTYVLRLGGTTAGIIAFIYDYPNNLNLNGSGLRANINAISDTANSHPNDTTTFTVLNLLSDSVTIVDTSPAGYPGMWCYRAIWGLLTNLTVDSTLPEGDVVVYLDYTDTQGHSQAGPDDSRVTAYVDSVDPDIICESAILRRQGNDVNGYINRGDTVVIVVSITEAGSKVDTVSATGVTANITALNNDSGDTAVKFNGGSTTVGSTTTCTWIISLAPTSPTANSGLVTITAHDIAGNTDVCVVDFNLDGADPEVTKITVFSEAGADSTTLNQSEGYDLPETYSVGTRGSITAYGDSITLVVELDDRDSAGNINRTAFLTDPNTGYHYVNNPGDTTLVWIDVSSITKGDLFDPADSDPLNPDWRNPTALYWDESVDKWIAV
ncbi:hypothetical protein KKC52_12245, partial [bacterium]|nr:hypothetical protein [bacterium]